MKHPVFVWKYHPSKRAPRPLGFYFRWLKAKNSSSNFVQEHELELAGIPLMFDALEYHYKNFQKFEIKARKKHQIVLDTLIEQPILGDYYEKTFFESMAYLSVVGRIDAFLKSWWISKYLCKDEVIANTVPITLALVPLRNKYSAHRGFDDPYKDEMIIYGKIRPKQKLSKNEVEQLFATQLMLGISASWRGMAGEQLYRSFEIQIASEDRHELLKKHHKSFINDIEWPMTGKIMHLTFIPSKHHRLIMQELRQFTDLLFTEALKKEQHS